MDQHALDDAAAAALWNLRRAPLEHVGLLYEQDGAIYRTDTVLGGKDWARGRFAIPVGSLRGVFHNHPMSGNPRKDRARREFSDDDKAVAKRLNRPSYIAAGNKLRRYDPATGRTEDVLAEIPIDVIRDYFHRRFFEGRDK